MSLAKYLIKKGITSKDIERMSKTFPSRGMDKLFSQFPKNEAGKQFVKNAKEKLKAVGYEPRSWNKIGLGLGAVGAAGLGSAYLYDDWDEE